MSRSIQLCVLALVVTLADLASMGSQPLVHVLTIRRDGRLGRFVGKSVAHRDSTSLPPLDGTPSFRLALIASGAR